MSTAIVQELRENLRLTTEVYGRGSMRTTTAFETLVRVAADAGAPIDGLRHHVADEVERFFSYTIPGVDGHVYWDGGKAFQRNDGKGRRPIRWWWQHKYGDLDPNDDLLNQCGERNCVNPEHFAKERVRGMRRQWSDGALIGRLQVVSMRLGHSPTIPEYDALGLPPRSHVFISRFGNWTNSLAAAGLTPQKQSSYDRTAVLRGIQLVRRLFGRWPSRHDYRRYGKELAAADLPMTENAAIRAYGSFSAARVAAGGPRLMGSNEGFTREQCRDAVLFVRDRIGRWPSRSDFVGQRKALAAAGLPSSERPVRKAYGSLIEARVAAGGPRSLSEEDVTRPHLDRTKPEKVIAGILFARDRLGRWPSQIEYRGLREALMAAGLPGSWGPAFKVFGSWSAARVAAGGPASLGGRSIRQSAGPSGRESPSSPRSES